MHAALDIGIHLSQQVILQLLVELRIETVALEQGA